jgi:hypothetical protein
VDDEEDTRERERERERERGKENGSFLDMVAKECSVATLVQGTPCRERDRLEVETV